MYDRRTESLWQQIGGKAIVGSMVGAPLTPLAAPIVSLGQFAESFPDGVVMSRDTGFNASYGQLPGTYIGYDTDNTPFLFKGDSDNRLDATARVVVLEAGGEPIAYPFLAAGRGGRVQRRARRRGTGHLLERQRSVGAR